MMNHNNYTLLTLGLMMFSASVPSLGLGEYRPGACTTLGLCRSFWEPTDGSAYVIVR